MSNTVAESGTNAAGLLEPRYMIDVKDVTVRYPTNDGGSRTILNNIGLRAKAGRFVTVVGPSGCGKTTLLNLILGSHFPTEGTVLVDGKQVTRVSRDRGIVYQSYSLFRNMTVLDNITAGMILEETNLAQRAVAHLVEGIARFVSMLFFPITWLKKRGSQLFACRSLCTEHGACPPAQTQESPSRLEKALEILKYFRVRRKAREKAYELIESIGLSRADAQKYPFELSGGMRQRVAIAQAITMKPKVLLMDEPFGALDEDSQSKMQDFIHEQWLKHGMTIFFVTHDLVEAIKLGTRLIFLSQYWCDDSGVRGEGAKVVVDMRVLGGEQKPSTFAQTPEFRQLWERISKRLDRDHLQPIGEFELTHEDAILPRPPATQADGKHGTSSTGEDA